MSSVPADGDDLNIYYRKQYDRERKDCLIMVILGILSWPSLARLVRAQVLAEREQEFVTAANAMGVNVP